MNNYIRVLKKPDSMVFDLIYNNFGIANITWMDYKQKLYLSSGFNRIIILRSHILSLIFFQILLFIISLNYDNEQN